MNIQRRIFLGSPDYDAVAVFLPFQVEPGPTPNLRRTSAGTEICPWLVILDSASAMTLHYHGNANREVYSIAPALSTFRQFQAAPAGPPRFLQAFALFVRRSRLPGAPLRRRHQGEPLRRRRGRLQSHRRGERLRHRRRYGADFAGSIFVAAADGEAARPDRHAQGFERLDIADHAVEDHAA